MVEVNQAMNRPQTLGGTSSHAFDIQHNKYNSLKRKTKYSVLNFLMDDLHIYLFYNLNCFLNKANPNSDKGCYFDCYFYIHFHFLVIEEY